MKKEEIEQEITKCQNSKAYFYNNYFLIDGKKSKTKLTDEDFDEIELKSKLAFLKPRQLSINVDAIIHNFKKYMLYDKEK